jgi:hypothetical protein
VTVGRPVSIVILAWNGLQYTRRCLETLRASTTFADYRVIVVDNGSDDGTPEYLATLDWVSAIRNEENAGFSRGNNLALRHASPDSDVILLNNDTEIHQGDWIERLQRTAHGQPDIGVVGCRLRRPDGTLQHAGAYMPPTYWGQQIGGLETDINQFNADREVDIVVFACAYLKRELLEQVGLLDEAYFSYYEDSDYCYRARAKGYRIVCCGTVTLLHHENISAAVNGVQFDELFRASCKVFRKRWEPTIEGHRYDRRLSWHSIVNFETGYAISSRQLMLALDRAGVELSYRYAYGPGTPFGPVEPAASSHYMLNVIRSRPFREREIEVSYSQADVFDRNTGRYRIGFTMLETDSLPPAWVEAANRMDEVWVPSSFNRDTFRSSGVAKPIHVIPLGIDPDYFNPSIRGHRLGSAFTFLSVSEWGERKAFEVLLKAFNDEFRSSEDVLLVCKTSNTDAAVDVTADVAGMKLRRNGGRIVFSLNETLPAHQLGALYRSADCFVLATRGEGWCLPALEAMACGLPVIATDWSSQRDFMNAANSYPLRVEALVPAIAKCPYYQGARWAQPSYEHLRTLLRHVYEHPEEARARGRQAAEDARSRWSWQQSARKILERLTAIGDTHS